jgi:hypothetical protein
MAIFEIPPELRTFEGMYAFFLNVNIEGLVLYHEGRVVKIRRDAFEHHETKENLGFPDPKLPIVRAPLWV